MTTVYFAYPLLKTFAVILYGFEKEVFVINHGLFQFLVVLVVLFLKASVVTLTVKKKRKFISFIWVKFEKPGFVW